MTLSFQRLLLILITLILLLVAILLILSNSKNNIIFFYTPSELLKSKTELNQTVRIGAFVEKGSLNQMSANNYEFNLSDNKARIMISYEGLLPDLFREGQGVVIEGKLIRQNYIKADKVYTKHDENYIPASIKKELEKNQAWKKEYK